MGIGVEERSVPAEVLTVGRVPEGVVRSLLRSGCRVLSKPEGWPDTPACWDAIRVLVTDSGTPVRDAELDRLPRLATVVRASAGLDGIDEDALERRGVSLYSAEANTRSTAELALGLILAALRHIPAHGRRLRSGEWSRDRWRGLELAEKRVGLVGLGRVGGALAPSLQALGATVAAVDPYIEPSRFRELGVLPYGELGAMLPDVRILSLHCPLTDETRGMIDRAALMRLPLGAVVINTARGGLLDEEALADLIQGGRLGGAALDCWSTEPPGCHRLLDLEQVVATPHIGARTAEARERLADEVCQVVLQALAE